MSNERFHENTDLMFKGDRQNLEGMLADIDVEEKINHVQKFMRQCRVPEKVIRTLHVPKPIGEENFTCQTVEDVNVASEKCAKQSVGCQTVMDGLMGYDVSCQTVGKSAVDDILRYDVGSQTVGDSAKQDVACQTVELFSSSEFDDHEDLSGERSTVGNKRKRDDEQVETRIIERSTSCCCRANCTDNDKLRESPENGVTKLLVLNLHPNVTEEDISVMFKFNFKSYQSSKINYYSTGKPLGTADIIFGERADALKAKKKFNGKKLDGQPIDIVLLDQKVFDFMPHGHFNKN